jgi:hypothetical protein
MSLVARLAGLFRPAWALALLPKDELIPTKHATLI